MAYRLSKVSFIPDNSVSFYSIEFYRMSWRLKRGEDFNVFFSFQCLKGPFGLRGEGGGVEGSRVKLAENRLILGQLYYTPPLSPSIQTDHKGPCVELFS